MARKGILTSFNEWAKHLRPTGKRMYWGAERAASRAVLRTELFEGEPFDEEIEEELTKDDCKFGEFIATRGYDMEGFNIIGVYATYDEAPSACLF